MSEQLRQWMNNLPTHKHHVGTTLEHCCQEEYPDRSYGPRCPRDGQGKQVQCQQFGQLFDGFWEGDEMDVNTLHSVESNDPNADLDFREDDIFVVISTLLPLTIVYGRSTIKCGFYLQIILLLMLSAWMTSRIERKM
jgi:hypothetical protein